MMKVTHIAPGVLSLAPYRLMQVQRLGGLDARLVSFRNTYPDWPYRYPYDRLMSDDPELIARLLREADVIHYHSSHARNPLFTTLPWTRDLVRDKPSVIQFHSSPQPEFDDDRSNPRLVKLVVAQYQARLYPECLPAPNAVPIDDPLHRALDVHNDPPIVGFTPSNRDACFGWGNKGCAETLPVLESGFHHRFVFDVCWEEAMSARQTCDIAIDEIVTGSYHMCSLESLSQGLATIAGLDAQTVDALEAVTGTRDHPWIVATPETLRRELTKLVEDDGYCRAKRREARRYMERYWNAEVIARNYERIYRRALG